MDRANFQLKKKKKKKRRECFGTAYGLHELNIAKVSHVLV